MTLREVVAMYVDDAEAADDPVSRQEKLRLRDLVTYIEQSFEKVVFKPTYLGKENV